MSDAPDAKPVARAAFISTTDRPQDWLAAFAELMPELEVRVHPDLGDVTEIDYALAWKPPPGLLASLPNLRAILSLGAGIDNIVSDPALPAVPLARMIDDGLTEGMTEYVVLHVLRYHRDLDGYRALQAEGRWLERPAVLARERRVGLLGLGVLASDAARALRALNFNLAAWTRAPRAPQQGVTVEGIDLYHGADGLGPFLERTEILICLLPLTPETTGIINAETLARLPRGAFVINPGRGAHVVDADLIAALDDDHIAGATLDVFTTEPLPGAHPFWTHPKVTVTPHVAAVTPPQTAARVLVEQIRRHMAGAPLRHVVDHARGY